MTRLRKVEIAGQWWALEPSGHWLGWDHDVGSWEPRPDGPPGGSKAAAALLDAAERSRAATTLGERAGVAVAVALAWALPISLFLRSAEDPMFALLPAAVLFLLAGVIPIELRRDRMWIAIPLFFGINSAVFLGGLDALFGEPLFPGGPLLAALAYGAGATVLTYWVCMVFRWFAGLDDRSFRTRRATRAWLWFGALMPTLGAVYFFTTDDPRWATLSALLAVSYCLMILWPPDLEPFGDASRPPRPGDAAGVGRMAEPLMRWVVRIAFFSALQLAAFVDLGGYLEAAADRLLISLGLSTVVTTAADRLLSRWEGWRQFAHLTFGRVVHAAAIVFVGTLLILLTPYYLAR